MEDKVTVTRGVKKKSNIDTLMVHASVMRMAN